MADEPDQARLRALQERLAKAQVKAAPQVTSGQQTGFSQGEVAWRMVIELVVGVLLGGAIGYGLDAICGSRPIFLVIFILFGFAAGVKTMMSSAKEMNEQAGKTPAAGEGE